MRSVCSRRSEFSASRRMSLVFRPRPDPMSSPTLLAITTLSRLPLRLSQLPNNGFRFAALVAGYPARIGVGGVDGIEAGVDKGIEDGERSRLVDVPAEHIAAQHQRRDVQFGLAEPAKFHELTLRPTTNPR